MASHGWRYCAIDVPYEHRTVMFGGPILFAATGIAGLVARRRRLEAECRPVGAAAGSRCC